MGKKKLNIGMIGYSFMGKAHSFAYKNVTTFYELEYEPVMKVICGRKKAGVQAACERYGWQEYATDWRKVIERDDVDVVDICAPGDTHVLMAVAAARAGKHLFSEKPLANNLADARAMLTAVRKAGVKHMVGFNYRTVPAIALAKRLIDEGFIGDVYHFRGRYLQDWIVDPDFPLVWRLDRKVAGSGPLGDLAAHTIDLSNYLVGEIDELVADEKTFCKTRPLPARKVKGTGLAVEAGDEKARRGRVTVEDAVMFLARYRNGALGVFESSRFCAGRKNNNAFEINGSKGSIAFDFEEMNYLRLYSREDPEFAQGFRKILVTEGCHKFAEAWWPPGHIIGYGETFVNEAAELCKAFEENRNPTPDFLDGAKCQAVLEAVAESIARKTWVKVPRVR